MSRRHKLVTAAGRAFGLRLGFIGPDLVVRRRHADPALRFYALKEELFHLQLAEILHCYQVNCVLDVGAARGRYGAALRELGYTGLIHSFEPVHEAFADLEQQVANDPLWLAHQTALGSSNSVGWLEVREPVELSSFLKSNARMGDLFGPESVKVRREEVSITRLDTLLADLISDLAEPRILLKMDTQGYDLEVFEGLGDWVTRLVALQSEVSILPIYDAMTPWQDSLDHFFGKGFELAGIFPVSRDPITTRIVELDCLLVRASSAQASR